MKRTTACTALLCLGFFLPTAASASCFFVFKGDQLVNRSIRPPVDLSKEIHETMVGRFAGGHLTMIPDESGCPDLLITGVADTYTSSSVGRSPIDSSPLFRTGAGGDGSFGSSGQPRSAANAGPGTLPAGGDDQAQSTGRRAPARGR